ncbi:TonB-dependent receptor [Bordetella petrii]|uniref:TonB-dependent receptor n=1 Tax=Bordetella petrii TaxID=94624 RepID=UPI001E524003|nr:TonB-dependent receptor [Bordetella petrii]MCD0501595.1 TonB-dependent receptor [Bordetella petrii]
MALRKLNRTLFFTTRTAVGRHLVRRAYRNMLAMGVPGLAAMWLVAPAYAQAAEAIYNLPPGDLGQALARFGNESGILLTFDHTLVAGKQTAGLQGRYSVPQALAALLAGTRLEPVLRPDGSYSLRARPETGAAAELPAVTVVGASSDRPDLPAPYAGGQVARGAGMGVLGDRDMLDTPFSVNSYTVQTIENQQAQSVADIATNDPAILNVDPTNASYANTFTVRGLLLGNGSIGFNGLFGLAPNNQTTLTGIERVEIIKGPTAFLNGMSPSGTGGAINLVPKRAADTPLTSFTASYLSDSQFGGHLDLGRRFGPENRVGIRLNAMYRDGDTSVDQQSQQLGTFTLGLDYRGDRFRVSADVGYQNMRTDRANSTIAPAVGQPIPNPPSAGKSFMSPWNFVDTEDTYGMLRGEFDINKKWTAYASVGRSNTDWKQVLDFGTQLQENGDFLSTTRMNFTGIERTVGEAGLRGQLDTGPVRHNVSFSVNGYKADRTSAGTTTLGSISSNIYDPVFLDKPDTSAPSRNRISRTVLSGYALSDTLSILDERAQLTLGVRKQKIMADNYNIATNARTSRYDKTAYTPVVGMLFKPAEYVSLYGSYIEGMQQGAVVGASYANANEVLEPYLSKQYEAGVKVDWGKLSTTLAAFQIEQASAIADPVSNTLNADGEQRNRGIELNVAGEPWRGVRVLGGYMLLDAKLTQTAGGVNNGKTAPGTSRHHVTLGVEWDTPFATGLTLTSRVMYASRQYVDAANTQSIKPWTTMDLGARYVLEQAGYPITLRANLRNVFNKSFWTTYPGAGTLNVSEGRSLLLSATVNF